MVQASESTTFVQFADLSTSKRDPFLIHKSSPQLQTQSITWIDRCMHAGGTSLTLLLERQNLIFHQQSAIIVDIATSA